MVLCHAKSLRIMRTLRKFRAFPASHRTTLERCMADIDANRLHDPEIVYTEMEVKHPTWQKYAETREKHRL
jgi:hypothetical protein